MSTNPDDPHWKPGVEPEPRSAGEWAVIAAAALVVIAAGGIVWWLIA